MTKDPSFISSSFIQSLVSVIIPTYNRNGFLVEAIQSAVSQTYRPIECIIVDDGSTDNTKEVVNDLIEKNTESFSIKYIHQQNAGSQVARNIGTVASNGEFIQYLDSDDFLYADKIKKQVIFLQENKNCDGVWGGWAKGTPEKNELIESIALGDLLTQFLTGPCVVNFSFLMRRKIIEKIGEWDVKIKRNQEIDFQVRGILNDANFQFQPQIGGLWRIHEGERIANTTSGKEFLNFYKKWEGILIQKGLFSDQMKRNIADIYYWLANIDRKDGTQNFSLLKEAVRLNPEIHFNQSRRMRFLRRFLNDKTSLAFWIIFNRF